MGPTSAGKTTLATYFVKEWRKANHPIIHFDGDEIRDFFGTGFGFEPEDRMLVISALVNLALKSQEAGLSVIISALTANEEARQFLKNNIPHALVGYVKCPIKVCAERDPKGLYAKAKYGEINTLIGFNTPYLPPESPDIVLDTASSRPSDLFSLTDRFLREL